MSKAVSAARRLGHLMWNFPRNIIIIVLRAYRTVISPLYGPVCRFFPSCSAYALEAVTVHGAVRGSILSLRRLIRCHPWNVGGVDHVPAGSTAYPADGIPAIVVLNHPVIPADEESRLAA